MDNAVWPTKSPERVLGHQGIPSFLFLPVFPPLKNIGSPDLPGGQVVGTLYFHFRGPCFDFWLGNWDPAC